MLTFVEETKTVLLVKTKKSKRKKKLKWAQLYLKAKIAQLDKISTM